MNSDRIADEAIVPQIVIPAKDKKELFTTLINRDL